jgi:hypothetical protein
MISPHFAVRISPYWLAKLGMLWHFGCSHILLILSPPLYPTMRTEPVFRPTVLEPSRVESDMRGLETFGSIVAGLVRLHSLQSAELLRSLYHSYLVELNGSLVLQFSLHNNQFHEARKCSARS